MTVQATRIYHRDVLALYEIHIPPGGDETSPRVERVHGENWLEALRRGLARAGHPAPTRNLGFEFRADGAVVVNDADAGRVYHVVPVVRPTPQPSSVAPPATTAAEPAPPDVTEPDEVPDPFADEGTAQAATPQRSGALDTVDYEEAGMLESQEMAEMQLTRSPETEASGEPHPLLSELDQLSRFPADVYGACAFVLDALRAHIPSEAGSVLLIDARDRCLYFAVARGPHAAGLSTQRVPLEVGLAGACIRSRRVLNIVDPAHDPRFARSIADAVGHMPRSILAAPIVAGRRAFGVLEILDRTERRGFTEEDEHLAKRAGRRLGVFFSGLLPAR